MTSYNGCTKKLCLLAVLAAALLIPAAANAEHNPANVRTTTDFAPPRYLGMASDGRIFAGNPLIGLEVVAVRITWDVVIDDGYDAADIYADVFLPIDTNSGTGAGIRLDGPTLGWSGSGTFHHYDETDRYNGFFGQEGTGFGWTAVPGGAGRVLSTSLIEIDYLVPEPSSAALLVISGLAVLRRRRRTKAATLR